MHPWEPQLLRRLSSVVLLVVVALAAVAGPGVAAGTPSAHEVAGPVLTVRQLAADGNPAKATGMYVVARASGTHTFEVEATDGAAAGLGVLDDATGQRLAGLQPATGARSLDVDLVVGQRYKVSTWVGSGAGTVTVRDLTPTVPPVVTHDATDVTIEHAVAATGVRELVLDGPTGELVLSRDGVELGRAPAGTPVTARHVAGNPMDVTVTGATAPLVVRDVTGPTPPNAVGNTDATTPPPTGDVFVGSGALDRDGDRFDPWFLTADDDTLTLRLTWDDVTADVRMGVRRDSDGVLIDSSVAPVDDGERLLTLPTTPGETYRIGVYVASGAASYDLHRVTTPLATEQIATGDLSAPDDTWDGETWTPARDGEHTITLDWPDASVDLRVGIRRTSDNAFVAATPAGATGTSEVTAALEAGTTYRFGVYLSEGATPWTLTATPPPDPGAPPPAPTDPSTVRITPTETAPHHLRVTATSGDLVAGLVVRTPAGDVLAEAPDGAVTLDLTDDAPVDVEITTASGSGDWRLDVAPRPAPTDAPNVLVIQTDDQRTDDMVVMDRTKAWFADGVEFTNGYVAIPSCCPSRSTLLSGRYVHNNGVVTQQGPATDESLLLPHYLREAGWMTGHVGKYLHYYDTDAIAGDWDRWARFDGGYTDMYWNLDGSLRTIEGHTTDLTFDLAAAWAREWADTAPDRPWFLHVNPYAPHATQDGPPEPAPRHEDVPVPPREIDAAILEADTTDKPDFLDGYYNGTSEELDALHDARLRSLVTVDDGIDRLLTELDAAGELDDTILVFASDNGYFLGEHGWKSKFRPHEESIRVPFLLRWPDGDVGSDGHVRTDHAATVDIAPTVLSALGITPDVPMDGVDLLGPERRTERFTEYFQDPRNIDTIPDWSSLADETFMYAEYRDTDGSLLAREYYDLVADPHQLTNLFGDGDPTNDPDVSSLEQRLAAMRACAGADCRP